MEMQAYLNLIPGQHRQKPRYLATLEGLLRPLRDLEATLCELRAAFDLDTAVGLQLDAVGERLGRSRWLEMPLTDVYFSLDVAGVGLDQGLWKGPYDPSYGLVALPDEIYRLLLKAKAAVNSWDGTTPGAYAAWETAFADQGSVIMIQDNQDMSVSIGIAGLPLGAVLRQLLLQNYLPLKSAGVRVRWYAVSEVAGPLFALDADSPALAGLDAGSWAKQIQSTIKETTCP